MKGPIARGTIRTTFILGLYTLVQAGTLLLVARMLGPHQFGAFAGIASLAVFLGTLSPFGTNVVLLREVAKEPSRRDPVLAYAIPTTLLCGSVLLVIYFAVCMLVVRTAKVPATVLLTIGITEICLQALFRLVVAEHQGLGRIARSQLLKTLPMVLRLTATVGVLLARTPDPLISYGYAYPAASLLGLMFAVRTFPSGWPPSSHWRLPTLNELRDNAGYAALTISASGPGELDKTLATKLLPLPIAGLYAVGTRIIAAVTLPVIAMMESALPRLFREGNEQPRRTSQLLLWIFGATFVYSLLIAIALWLTSPIFEWLFGTRFHGLDHMLRWLCLVVPGMALRMSVGNALMALGRPWVRVMLEIAGLMTLITMAVAFTVLFSENGMPLALACSEWLMAVVGWTYLLRHLSMHPRL